MIEAVTINNEDIVSGWSVKKWAENPGEAKKQKCAECAAELSEQ